MKIEYELNKQDYIDFNVYHIKHSDVLKKSLLLQRYLVPITYLFLSFVFTMATEIPFWYWFTAFSVVIILWIAFYPKYFMSSTMKKVSKMIDEGKNKDLLGKHSVIVTEKGLVEKSENGENIINWNGVEKIVSIDSYFFIYVSSISACIIPKRVFETGSSKDEFFQFVSRMLERK